MKFYFLNTCYACPEQYDVYRTNGQLCGYVRLRWGTLRADYPNINGNTIYTHTWSDDFKGNFESDEERNKYLQEISIAYKEAILKKVPVSLDLSVEFEIFTDISELEERVGKVEES